MAQRIAQKDIAAAAGVSRSAVSHYLNGRHRFLSEETGARIARALEELDYVPTSAAMRLRGQRNEVVTLLLPFLSSLQLSAKLEAIATALDRRGHAVQFNFHFGRPERLRETVRYCIEEQHRTVIYFPGYLTVADAEEHLDRLARHGTHLLIADMLEETRLQADRVVIDRPHGARLAMEHLLGIGKRIGGVFRLETDRIEDNFRYVAYRDALAEAGIPLEPDLLLVTPIAEPAYAESIQAVRVYLQQLQAGGALPDALFCNNDEIAMAAVNAAADLGLAVPDDLSVMGYNDDKVAVSHRPSISTVRQPVEELAESVAEAVERRRATPEAKPVFKKLKPTLVLRESTRRSAPDGQER